MIEKYVIKIDGQKIYVKGIIGLTTVIFVDSKAEASQLDKFELPKVIAALRSLRPDTEWACELIRIKDAKPTA